jgi:hypothetical protein
VRTDGKQTGTILTFKSLDVGIPSGEAEWLCIKGMGLLRSDGAVVVTRGTSSLI